MSTRCDLLIDAIPRTGNNVSHSNAKTSRIFRLNIKSYSFYSLTLGTYISLSLCRRAARALLKSPNIDSFLLKQKAKKLTKYGLSLRKKAKLYFLKNNVALPDKTRSKNRKFTGARILALKNKHCATV